jgi:hypothetical protein
MIPYLRLYDLSIINYLKYEVLPANFVESITGETLTYDTSLSRYTTSSSMLPLPTSTGRGWALFDESVVNGLTVIDTTAEQASQITVNGATTYTIDYANGHIIDPDTVPTSVDYSWYYVSVIEGWPGTDPPALPIVSVDIDSSQKAGFQLGGGTKDTIEGSVYVFATNESEKKDITDVIYQAFYNKTLTVGNWHEGSYLDYDGTYTGFVPTAVTGLSTGIFSDVSAKLTGGQFGWSELNRHRSRIKFAFEVYKD